VRQVPPRAWPGGTGTGVTSPGNTAEPSRELSAGDLVAAGDVLLAVAPAGWEPVTGPLTEVRTREHGTNPLPLPGRAPGSWPASQSEKEDHGE
jgi:hypothetical protein